MYTSMLLLALIAAPAADADDGPTWMSDYSAAVTKADADKKPLAVFVGSGQEGYMKLSRDGKLGKAVDQLLAKSYVPVYIDSTTPKGQKMAKALELTNGLGLVLSDRTGNTMAFYHEGDLARADLLRYLNKYADPDLVVERTETNPATQRTSYYGPGGAAPAGTPSISYYPPTVPAYYGGGSGGCAGGRCR